MHELFAEKSQIIKIHVGIEQSEDPYEKNVSTTLLPPYPIRAIVTDVVPTSANWKMPGIITEKTREIIIKSKYKTLLEQSQKITIHGEDDEYYGWRTNGRLNYRVEADYLRCYIYVKKET